MSYDVEKLVKVYVKIRDAKAELAKEFSDKEKDLNAQLAKIEAALLEHCKDTGQEGGKTKSGTFYRTVDERYWTSDWESMNSFILEHGEVGLLERRLSKKNLKQFMEERPDLHPPGLNIDRTYKIGVRRGK